MSESTRVDRNSGRRSKYDAYSDSGDGSPPRRRDKDSRRDGPSDMRSHSHRDGRRQPDDRDVDDYTRKHRRDRKDHDSGQNHKANSRRERRYRERSASQEHSHHRRRSESPPTKRARRSESGSRSPRPVRRSRAPLPSQDESFRGTGDVVTSDGPPVEKQKPNYKPTGLLAKEANTVVGTTTVLKYHEPPEARKPPPKEQWRMYVFKKKDLLDTIYLHERSVWLMGRDQNVTDLLLEHPSISKQHAVIQFRYITTTNEFGDKQSRVKPYLIDLESANGTKLNGKKLEASRYVELVDGDVIAFGDSEREYVMMLPPAEK